MPGLDAIAQHNGWAMALIGALIVFLGLVVLSFAVSRIHMLLAFWENRSAHVDRLKNGLGSNGATGIVSESDRMLPGRQSAVRQLKLIVDRIGEPFSLPKLLDLAEKAGMARARTVADDALGARIIIPDGSGNYIWQNCDSGEKAAE